MSTKECVEPSFYVMASSEYSGEVDQQKEGLAACTSTVAAKPTPMGTIKSTNYLQNALAQILAEAQGLDVVSSYDQ